jgi:hypothetical protein
MTIVKLGDYPSPRRVHERRNFFKHLRADIAKTVIATRKLRWSSPLLFNDPFDFSQELRLGFDEAQLSAAVTEKIASLLERGEPPQATMHPKVVLMLRLTAQASEEVRRELASELRKSSAAAARGQFDALQELKSTWKAMVPGFRVLCLSEVNDATPMWAHYAGGYTGAVLEFRAIDELDSGFLLGRPVEYRDVPAIAAPADWAECLITPGAVQDRLFREYQYVKTPEWSYEREWRIVTGARPKETEMFGDYAFHPLELSAIYFGPKCSAQDRSDLLVLLAHGLAHVEAYDAIITDARKLVFRGVSR